MTPEELKQRAILACKEVQASGKTIQRGSYGFTWVRRDDQAVPVIQEYRTDTDEGCCCALGAVINHEGLTLPNPDPYLREFGPTPERVARAIGGICAAEVLAFTRGFDGKLGSSDSPDWYRAGADCAAAVLP